MLTGRVLSYVYVGMEASTIPILQSEITPTAARGFIVGAFQFSIYLGGLIIHIITNATSNRTDSSAWRIPVGLFLSFHQLLLSLLILFPNLPVGTAVRVNMKRDLNLF